MVETPDGHGRLELVKFHAPSGRGGDRHAPANTPGIRHIAFAVDDIDAVVARLRARGAELVGGNVDRLPPAFEERSHMRHDVDHAAKCRFMVAVGDD